MTKQTIRNAIETTVLQTDQSSEQMQTGHMDRRWRRLLAAAAGSACLLIGACALDPGATPTHYWTSEKDQTTTQYKRDNFQCEEYARGQGDAQDVMLAGASFESYRDCMISRGYVLRTY